MKNTILTNEYKNYFHNYICYENIKRNQIYSTLNYIISSCTIFDFFSKDAFNLVVFLQYILMIENNKLKKTYIKTSNSNLLNLLFRYKINLNKLNNILENITDSNFIKLNIPIITKDILLFAFIDKNNYFLRSKHINKYIWYITKYNILKKIHKYKISLNKINKNESLFLFLLISQISEHSFIKLLQNKNLNRAVFMFRNIIISKMLKINLNEIIRKEINTSYNINIKRTYFN
jgi:hypothetical protein